MNYAYVNSVIDETLDIDKTSTAAVNSDWPIDVDCIDSRLLRIGVVTTMACKEKWDANKTSKIVAMNIAKICEELDEELGRQQDGENLGELANRELGIRRCR